MSCMSNLNSVLVEGVVTTDPLPAPGGDSCVFQILSERRCAKPGGKGAGPEKSVFVIEVLGNLNLAEACLKYGKEGRGVRVVGRLKESFGTCECGREHPTFAVVAEHVEFRPEFKKSNSTKRKQQASINKE